MDLVLEKKADGNYLSGRWGSNPQPSAWEADILPLNYARVYRIIAMP